LIDEEPYHVGNPEFALSRILQGRLSRDAQGQKWGMTMIALVQAATCQTEGVSDFSVVALFGLVGIVLSLVIAHFGFDITSLG
jgi:hypothetical protein